MTERIGQEIGAELDSRNVETTIKRADAVNEQDFKDSDVWIFGSPVHFFGPSKASKRALSVALRVNNDGKFFTTFDTRYASYNGPGAAGKMANMLKDAGVKMITEPELFIVESSKGPLAKGEEIRASDFGKKIAQEMKF